MNELIYGLIILIFPLTIVFIFLIKWRRDYKLTKRFLVLNPMEYKRQLLFGIPFLILSVLIIYSASQSPGMIEDSIYKIKEWNPCGWIV
jgi:hypothetical protein